jgi:N-acetylneuraminic acid mutarotase
MPRLPKCRPPLFRHIGPAVAWVVTLLTLSACGGDSLAPPPGEPDADPTVATLANSWTSATPMPTGRTGVVAATVDGMVYAIGGADHPSDGRGKNLRTVEGYSPSAKLWFYVAPLPAARAYPNGATVINGKIYVTGGLNQPPPLFAPFPTRTLFVYDVAQKAWTRKADMPVASYGGASASISGKLYVVTAGPNAKDGTSLYRYDPGTDTWTKRASPPHHHHLGTAGAINGKLYLAGGLVGGKTELGDLDVYDPATNTWTTRASMPGPRFAAAGRVINGKLYVAGGGDDDHVVSNRLEVYDPATNTWVTKPNLPTARWSAGAAVSGGALYIVGGSDYKVSTAIEAYTP